MTFSAPSDEAYVRVRDTYSVAPGPASELFHKALGPLLCLATSLLL